MVPNIYQEKFSAGTAGKQKLYIALTDKKPRSLKWPKRKNLGAEDLNLGHKKYAACKRGSISHQNYKPSHAHVLNSIVYIPWHFWVF